MQTECLAFTIACPAPGTSHFDQSDLRNGKAVVPVVRLLRATPYGGTLWFRYSSELTAKITTPPGGRHHDKQFIAAPYAHCIQHSHTLIAAPYPHCIQHSHTLTYGLGHSQGLGTVKRQAGEGPDDWMDFLCDVQRDSHNGARVLPHSHPPRAAGRSPRGSHIAPKASDTVISSPTTQIPHQGKTPGSPQQRAPQLYPGQVWLGSNRISRVGS